MSDAAGPRRRSTHVSSDAIDDVDEQTFIASRRGAVAAPVDEDIGATVVGQRRSVAPEPVVADEDFDEQTFIAARRSNSAVLPEPVADDEDLDENTVIGTRRSAVPSEPVADDDDFDENTVIGSRRSVEVEPDEVDVTVIGARRSAVPSEPVVEGLDENTVIGSRRSGAAAEFEAAPEVDEATVIVRRRSSAASPEVPEPADPDATEPGEPDDIEATQLGGRRAARLAAAELLEPTDPGQRRAQVDDATAVSKRKSGLEATIKSLRKPKINPPAKIETLSLANRRTTQILDDAGQPVSREAFTPEEAILKAPYKPRKQTIIPVVHLDRQLDTRPPKPFAESMTALARQRSAARRRVAVMAAVGGGTIVLSVGGIIALLLLG